MGDAPPAPGGPMQPLNDSTQATLLWGTRPPPPPSPGQPGAAAAPGGRHRVHKAGPQLTAASANPLLLLPIGQW